MCGIAGAIHLNGQTVPHLDALLHAMNELQHHRGPDGVGTWKHQSQSVGLAHRRLTIIDTTNAGAQPMRDPGGNLLVFNGEIYNYIELRKELGEDRFSSTSDTEVILHAYRKWGIDCVQHLRGMFAFALWDEEKKKLFCARDRFGIKPFYYTVVDDVFYFASEIKALLPVLPAIETDVNGLKEYLTFQFCLEGKTLFKGVQELPPAHLLEVSRQSQSPRRYWEVYYNLDFHHTERYFEERLTELVLDSINVHKRADVPIGAYLSGGLDSSIVASVAARENAADFEGFTGKFTVSEKYDESQYAEAVARNSGFRLNQIDITAADFLNNVEKVIYHLDHPIAGPGSFPQYMVSQLVKTRRKVVLGGQGGDEIFGGYVRYLIAYFEQCIKAAIDGTMHSGNFVVTYDSIIPNLCTLRQYKPLLKEFWREGLFEDIDKRYFRLVNRAPSLGDEVRWELLGDYDIFDTFRNLFGAKNVGKESYFDSMTHFDFKTLLPALLHVEDRVSMAHSVESRVPFLDHPLVELAATMPADVKFKDGQMKNVLKNSTAQFLPKEILERKDKMGFPVPLSEWMRNEARDFVMDTLSNSKAQSREYIDNGKVIAELASEPQYGRKLWGLLSLEIWQQQFHDRASYFKQLPHQLNKKQGKAA